MGRKIPAKKHRGVKDPLVQQARRLQSLRGKINAPPKDPDEQPVPRSLTRLFSFQNKEKELKQKQRKNKNLLLKDVAKKSIPDSDNPIAQLKKLPGETGRSFSLRINSAVKALHDPLVQQDYNDDLEADDVKGERMAAQRERRQRKRKAAKDTSQPEEQKLSRAQKLALKKKAKKTKAEEDVRPEVTYDHVGFGEVTHAPPALPVKPRHAGPDNGAPRPGRRDLLLSAMLQGPGGGSGLGVPRGEGGADRLRRERARLDVVAAYRALKKERRLNKNDKRKPG